jgi:hypothetical protein
MRQIRSNKLLIDNLEYPLPIWYRDKQIGIQTDPDISVERGSLRWAIKNNTIVDIPQEIDTIYLSDPSTVPSDDQLFPDDIAAFLIASREQRPDFKIIIDQANSGFSDTTFAFSSLIDEFPNLIVLNTSSKRFGESIISWAHLGKNIRYMIRIPDKSQLIAQSVIDDQNNIKDKMKSLSVEEIIKNNIRLKKIRFDIMQRYHYEYARRGFETVLFGAHFNKGTHLILNTEKFKLDAEEILDKFLDNELTAKLCNVYGDEGQNIHFLNETFELKNLIYFTIPRDEQEYKKLLSIFGDLHPTSPHFNFTERQIDELVEEQYRYTRRIA